MHLDMGVVVVKELDVGVVVQSEDVAYSLAI